MNQATKISEITNLVNEARASCEVLRDEARHKRAELAEIESKFSIESAKLEGLEQALSILVPSQSEVAKKERRPVTKGRRMRLGAKKRVVLEMVQLGLNTTMRIEDFIGVYKINIEARTVKDTVRKSLSVGELVGDFAGSFVLSQEGKEKLLKSPLPKDWYEFQEALAAIEADMEEAAAEAQIEAQIEEEKARRNMPSSASSIADDIFG